MPVEWKSKSSTEIINDINRVIDEYAKSWILSYQPYWSVVPINIDSELERLEGMRESIAIHFDIPINSIMFLGTTTEKDDMWHLPSEGKIIKIGRLAE
jgi:hypothetical protein